MARDYSTANLCARIVPDILHLGDFVDGWRPLRDSVDGSAFPALTCRAILCRRCAAVVWMRPVGGLRRATFFGIRGRWRFVVERWRPSGLSGWLRFPGAYVPGYPMPPLRGSFIFQALRAGVFDACAALSWYFVPGCST